MTELVHRLLGSASPQALTLPHDRHTLLVGATGYGKTYFAVANLLGKLDDRTRAQAWLDPEGEFIPLLVERLALICPDRPVHILKPTSTTHAFGLGLLDVKDPRDIQACHDVTVRALAVLQQVVSFGGDYGPRTSKEIYLGCFGLARLGLPFAALPEIFTAESRLRAIATEAMAYPFVADQLRAIDALPPRARVDYTDPLISRALPLLGSPMLRRIFGQPPGRNLDFVRTRANAEIIGLDLGGCEHITAKLIGTSFVSLIYQHAVQVPLTGAVPLDVTIDELPDFIVPDYLRGLDRLRKRRTFFTGICQRLSHFDRPDDPTGLALSAVLSGCRNKVVMGGLSPDDSELMTRVMLAPHIDLDTVWKQGSQRPVVVGHDRVTLTSRAHVRHHIEQSAHAVSDARSTSRMQAVSQAVSSGWGTNVSTGDAMSAASLPDGTLISPPTPLSRSLSTNTARGRAASGATSRARVAAEQTARSHAQSTSHGSTDGISAAHGTHEAFLPRLVWLESESYSLEEKRAAMSSFIQTLPPRAALVKVDNNVPFVARTPDLAPAFRSAAFRARVMALYKARLAQSPYLRPVDVVDAEIEAALTDVIDPTIPDDRDFSEPEPAAPRLRVISPRNDR